MSDSVSTDRKRLIIKDVIDTYNRSGNRGQFREIHAEDIVHIVPTNIRAENGTTQAFTPMLDTPISIAFGRYALRSLVDEVLAQVSQKRGIQILTATVPLNVFAQAFVTEEARDEPARDVLLRAFDLINGPRFADGMPPLRLTWHLLYNPNGRHYFFNCWSVDPDEEAGTKSGEAQQEPHL
jgi:hypothetical protein